MIGVVLAFIVFIILIWKLVIVKDDEDENRNN